MKETGVDLLNKAEARCVVQTEMFLLVSGSKVKSTVRA